ncbi:hypothetical protein PF005_g18169 [Phytophthora fragariae]|uniref:Uncharacterized protein n=1 Tax=Phytophthora fragariae TaxID=53985 RepID=A0A6A3RAY9_9STRA|nr:hypothetical protein PF011_g17051 [Phytophthora fragariae]KAE9092651.1 hypothetical protein PF007_g18404 [Phytophthora fragariae]KAE9093091.1 hypothetical protein PF010_g17626 [Phytophthora fragariae]KAE9124459.1 hypothetical protein PF006_g17188 [Phytophthora fragariae]KAE9193211.1 hypothetical protein PF005_g18169 [Phytophthora fragariae]
MLGSVKDYEVDHRIETQMFSFFWQFDIFQNTEEKHDVMACARDDFVNTLPNLLVTWASTNQGKGRAVTNSLEDLLKFSLSKYDRLDLKALNDILTASFNVPIVAPFEDRLREQELGRDSTRAIRREMGHSRANRSDAGNTSASSKEKRCARGDSAGHFHCIWSPRCD